MSPIQTVWIACIVILCCSCSSPVTTPAPLATQSLSATGEVDDPLLTLSPLSFSGDSFFTSDPFELDASGKVEVSWEYSGDGPYAIWLLSNDEFSSDPQYDRILIRNVDEEAPTGKLIVDLIAGSYVIEVEIASGPWQITVTAGS